MRSFQAAKLIISAFFPIFAATVVPTCAESVLNFPRLSNQPGTVTGAAFLNPTGESADLIVTAYGENGAPLAGNGINNPANLTVAAGQQLALVTSDPQLFGPNVDPSAVAWFQATSETDNLTGFFLFLDTATTIFDGADLPPMGRKIVFNQVRIDGGRATELNIINPEDDPTGIDLLLISGEDIIESNPDGIDFTIPARGVARLDAGEFFQLDAVEPGAYILVLSDTNIGGFQFVRSPGGDLLGLNARCLDEQLTDIYFPQLAVLGPWLMEIGVTNYAPQPTTLIITAHRPDGTLYEAPVVQQNRVVRNLGSGLSLRENVQAMFGFSGVDPLDGWVKVEATNEAVNGFVTYGVPAVGSIAAVAAPARALRRAVFSHIATTLGFFTGVAALNPSSLTANLRILALRPSGQILGRFDAVLKPGERISRVLSEIIPEAAGQAGGIIWVSSDRPLYLTSLFGTITGSVLANIPPQLVPADYRPDAGLPSPTVAPTFVVARLNETFQFEADGLENPVWSLAGNNGGTAGTIDVAGLFQAPASPPPSLPITVLAQADSFAAAATVDVLAPQTLRDNLEVGPLAYLPVQRRLYAVQSDDAGDSRLLEISENAAVELESFPGEEIPAMTAFADFLGDESLLLTGRTSGSVIRYDTLRRQVRTVVGGFDQPSSLALDPVTGNLVVADNQGLTLVSRAQLESDVVSGVEQNGALPRLLVETSGIGGVAVDGCTGVIFYSHTASGELRSYDPVSGAIGVAAEGFQSPDFLLGLQRAGAPCGGSSFHLLAAERGAGLFSLTALADGVINDWLTAPGSGGAALLPADNPFSDGEALALARGTAPQGAASAPAGTSSPSLTLVPTLGLYGEAAVNPLDARPVGSVADPAGDIFQLQAETHDLVELSALASGSAIDVLISFADPAENSRGFVEIDLDSNPLTGTTAITDFNTPYSSGMGIDLCIDLCGFNPDTELCGYDPADGTANAFRWVEEQAAFEFAGVVSVSYESRSVLVGVPFALLEGFDQVRLSAVFGPDGGPTDAAPNGGYLISSESGPVIAGAAQVKALRSVQSVPVGKSRRQAPAVSSGFRSRWRGIRLP